MQRKGPSGGNRSHNIAVTRFRLSQNIQTQSRSGRCSIGSASFGFSARIVLPRWEDRSGAGAATIAWWKNLAAYARVHEQQHITIMRRELAKIRRDVLAIPSLDSCSALRSRAKVVTRRGLVRMRQAHLRYDANERGRVKRMFAAAR
jgi:predicted secreted Zn-dependent protease